MNSIDLNKFSGLLCDEFYKQVTDVKTLPSSNNPIDFTTEILRETASKIYNENLKINDMLHLAVIENDIEIVLFLLTHGADIDNVDSNGKTALIHAIEANSIPMFELLLSFNPNLEAKKDRGSLSALECALINKNPILAQTLIAAGSNTSATFSSGLSPIAESLQLRYFDVANSLIVSGSDLNIGVNDFTNPLSIAIDQKDIKTILLLLDHGADVNYLLGSGNSTPLLLAVKNEEYQIITKLLERGANPNIGKTYYDTAFGYAENHHLHEICNLILPIYKKAPKLGLWNIDKNATYKCLQFNLQQPESINPTIGQRKYVFLRGDQILDNNKSFTSWCQPIEKIDNENSGTSFISDKLYEVIVTDIGACSQRKFYISQYNKWTENVKVGDVIVVPGSFLNDWNNRIYSPTKELCFWFQPTNILSEDEKSHFIQFCHQRRMA